MKQSYTQNRHVTDKLGFQGCEVPVGTETHSLLDCKAKVSLLPASRTKRELVFPKQKNPGRIILDKASGTNSGNKCRQTTTGALRWFLTYLSPLPPTLHPCRFHLLCPLALISGRGYGV